MGGLDSDFTSEKVGLPVYVQLRKYPGNPDPNYTLTQESRPSLHRTKFVRKLDGNL